MAIFKPVVGDFYEHFRTMGFSIVSLSAPIANEINGVISIEAM
jgi:hypothetical protein